jgi:5S rRNA maturation endonuclease (ribonuclease M5)
MSINKFRPYVFVLPEDDANRQLANGFLLGGLSDDRQIQVLPVAGGWIKVIERFKTEHLPKMKDEKERHVVLLIDFDNEQERLNEIKKEIPTELENQVFVLGVWSEPEKLRSDIRLNYEKIGQALAQDCEDQTDTTWNHALLRHNAGELARLREFVRPILFST